MRKPKPFALTNLRKTMVPAANCQQVFNPILAFVQQWQTALAPVTTLAVNL